MYNVVLYFVSGVSRVKSLMVRIINSTLEGLNNKERLPKYVLMMLDKDLIENLDYFDFGVTEILDDCLYWLVKEINKIFEIRRDDLKSKKLGSLSTATEPRVIWVAMIHRPIIQDERMKEIYNKRSKFNRALSAAVTRFRYHHIMYIDNVCEESHFDRIGKLTAKGKSEMWLELIHQVKLFDSETINLKPRPPTSMKQRNGKGDEC